VNPLSLLVGVLVRTVVILAVIGVVVLAIDHSDSTDALGAGLMAFLVLVTVAFAWALIDGVRRGFVPALLAWILTSAAAGVGIPVVISLGSSEGAALDDAVFFGLLLLVPAAVGLVIGGAVHGLSRRSETPA
jgi:membrane protease YdiL (CAAX protease family)